MHLETCQRCLGRKRDLPFNQFFGKDYPPYYAIDKDVHARKLPLILFTLLTQIGFGAFIALMMVKLTIWFRFPGSDYQWTLKGYFGILLTTVFSMFFSLSHLAAPSRGVRALANFRTSWLSREIFLLGFFLF
jgi:DMSO reductase anchor subunit